MGLWETALRGFTDKSHFHFIGLLPVAAISFVIVAVCGLPTIRWLKLLRPPLEVREDLPERHQNKAGTPTMGGLLIIVATIVATLLASRYWESLAACVALGAMGAVGFADDFIKARAAKGRGLKARHKLVAQALLSAVLTGMVLREGGSATSLVEVPMTTRAFELGSYGYGALGILLFAGTCNAVNVTDGLDGLAAGLVAFSAAALGAIALLWGEWRVAIFCAALFGSLLGFLIYNRHPAKVWMGDTGAMALGGALAMTAMLLRVELLLLLIGLPFVIEALTVVIQVVSFKTTGRRVFRMTPIHHAFELRGWSEWRIVLTFWAVGLLSAVTGVAVWTVR